MRRTLFLTVALLTFLLGTTLAGVRRWIANSQHELAEMKLSVPSVDSTEGLTPLRIGIFIGVDGATLSADGKKFEFYEDYLDRETLVPMSPAELSDLVAQLRTAGLFEEAESNSPYFISLPQTFTIEIAWPDHHRSFTWIRGDECRVPEKYLPILERFNTNRKLEVVRQFIDFNRSQESSQNGCFKFTDQDNQ